MTGINTQAIGRCGRHQELLSGCRNRGLF